MGTRDRSRYKLETYTYNTLTLINKYNHKNIKPIYAVFVDFFKAFNSVWRPGLLKKKYLDLGIKCFFYKKTYTQYI